jgi:putative spermidine/putrescine transport system ATP-binding protein
MTSGASPTPRKGSVDLIGVSKRYGEERVVDRVELSVSGGEFFSLLGPSGSGKTTTLMMIAGFAAVDEGGISIDGVDITGLPPQKRGFGMVFQNYAVFPHLDVFENVAFPLRARHVAADAIEEKVGWALSLVHLDEFAHRYSRQLSGGQQQRVAIARAIVFEPRIVLMDEPLGALDKNLRYAMQVEIKDIQRRLGMTVVYVTHDQEEALNMSDRIAIMNRGRIEQVGTPAQVYEAPETSFVARFLGEANILDGEVVAIANDVATLRVGAHVVAARVPGAARIGEQRAVFVRPEKVLIGESRGAAMNTLPGIVRRISFLGNVIRYGIEVAPSTMITVDAQNAGGERPPVGSEVMLHWPPADTLLLAG